MFLLCVDRDGDTNRRTALDNLEGHFASVVGPGKFFASENAWQELEVWLLAGHDLPADWSWQAVRQERDPKEAYLLKLAAARGLLNDPGEGRKTMGIQAARKYRRIYSRCREDIQVLEKRLDKWLNGKVIMSWGEAFKGL